MVSWLLGRVAVGGGEDYWRLGGRPLSRSGAPAGAALIEEAEPKQAAVGSAGKPGARQISNRQVPHFV